MSSSICGEEVLEHAAVWVNDGVHPSCAAHKKMADNIVYDIVDNEAQYMNPPKAVVSNPARKLRLNLSLERVDWVRGYSTALPK
jgi:hypothetical protein